MNSASGLRFAVLEVRICTDNVLNNQFSDVGMTENGSSTEILAATFESIRLSLSRRTRYVRYIRLNQKKAEPTDRAIQTDADHNTVIFILVVRMPLVSIC